MARSSKQANGTGRSKAHKRDNSGKGRSKISHLDFERNLNKQELELDSKELVILSQLYLNKDYPHGFLTVNDIQKQLCLSKNTILRVMTNLEERGFILKEKGYIIIYYPIANDDVRKHILTKLGFYK